MIKLSKQLVLLLPALASALLFGGALFGYILPETEDIVMKRRMEMVESLTSTAYSVIASYSAQVKDGSTSRAEAQADSLARLRMLRYGSSKKDYFWINDLDGVLLMHPYRKDLVGQNVLDLTDQDGVRMFREFVKVAKEKGFGFVSYRWQHYDDPKDTQRKVSFVRLFEPWGWVIGTGIYLGDLDQEMNRLALDIALLGGLIWAVVAGLSVYIFYRRTRLEFERIQAEEAIRESEQRLSEIIDFLPDPTWVIDVQGRVMAWNQAIVRLTGIPADYMIGKSGKQHAVAFYGEPRLMLIDLVLHPNTAAEEEFPVFRREGNRLYGEFYVPDLGRGGVFVASTAGPLYDHAGKLVGAIQTVRDITRRKQMEQDLLEAATKDSLTGVNNRHHFMELAQEELKRYQRHKRPLAMMMLDLDHFKNVNDTYGHHVGDIVLIEFSKTCSAVIREIDYFGRLGGEEFGILLVESGVDDARQVAERVRRQVEDMVISVKETEITITVSIGLTMLNSSDSDFKEVLQRADRALYQAKNEGRNRVVEI